MAEYIVNARPSDLFGIKITGKIIRCKDCGNAVVYDENEVVCTHIDSNGNDTHSANWYCADGVAKDIDVPNKEGRRSE